ncbi:MAG: ATP-grasp domain-containing protein [Candidatus Sericytochromatia bacterium]
MTELPLLIIPYKSDTERDAVAAAWQARGWEVLRLDRFWEPPVLEAERVKIYGGIAFAYVVAQKLNLDLLSPSDTLILDLDRRWTSRQMHPAALAELDTLPFPTFIKPASPKLFDAQVYADAAAVRRATKGLKADTQLLVSDIVSFTSEYRCWCLQGQVLTTACYRGPGQSPDPSAWVTDLLQAYQLFAPMVVDVGFIPDQGWAVVEFNSCWGAGLNGADPAQAVDCIAAATRYDESQVVS